MAASLLRALPAEELVARTRADYQARPTPTSDRDPSGREARTRMRMRAALGPALYGPVTTPLGPVTAPLGPVTAPLGPVTAPLGPVTRSRPYSARSRPYSAR